MFAGCASLAFWMKIGFKNENETFEMDYGTVPAIRFDIE